MTKERTDGAKPTRRQTAEHKAAKLAKTFQADGAPTEPATAPLDHPASAEADAQTSTDVLANPRAAIVKAEIARLRAALREATSEYNHLVGQKERDASKTVSLIIDMLSQKEGATKATLVAETGAKKGYVDALLSRILPAKGFVITSVAVEGTRTRAYRLQQSKEESAER